MKSPKRDMGSCHVASQTLTHLDATKVHASLVSYMKVCWQSMGWSPGTLYFMTISMRKTMLNIAQLLNIFQTQLVVRKSPFPGFMGYLRGYPEWSHLFHLYLGNSPLLPVTIQVIPGWSTPLRWNFARVPSWQSSKQPVQAAKSSSVPSRTGLSMSHADCKGGIDNGRMCSLGFIVSLHIINQQLWI